MDHPLFKVLEHPAQIAEEFPPDQFFFVRREHSRFFSLQGGVFCQFDRRGKVWKFLGPWFREGDPGEFMHFSLEFADHWIGKDFFCPVPSEFVPKFVKDDFEAAEEQEPGKLEDFLKRKGLAARLIGG
jgi:hypothetical protein